jgi:hypothetical protein
MECTESQNPEFNSHRIQTRDVTSCFTSLLWYSFVHGQQSVAYNIYGQDEEKRVLSLSLSLTAELFLLYISTRGFFLSAIGNNTSTSREGEI